MSLYVNHVLRPFWRTTTNRLWSTVASATQPAKQVKVPLKPPTNKMINEFKSAKIIIRVPVDKDPCVKLKPKELTCKINAALLMINAKIDDNIIQVKGASRLPSGDLLHCQDILLIHTYNHIAAHWILENCHCWTEIVHKDFTTMRPTFPVLLQSVPTKFDPADPNFIKELANQNHLPIEVFHTIHWLVKPIPPKTNGSLIIHVFDKLLAAKIGCSDLVFDGLVL
ncbi:hypothetical protein CROQUDRAFT_688145 [Cronartium quercuum f. sp. fusiforme G11]|uniref:Uncharacterized protein n=1 Tax=Cronartium quercuum f. sp. fusiforme G11 TaxID=708437 RepID=A0A9P6N6Z7_9BASI|nr:hypothetical protein CROQUDRAFT_688145 [Cronartium quercuum f. sp. fusiforme G11]